VSDVFQSILQFTPPPCRELGSKRAIFNLIKNYGGDGHFAGNGTGDAGHDTRITLEVMNYNVRGEDRQSKVSLGTS
jgi:hypothetical protein